MKSGAGAVIEAGASGLSAAVLVGAGLFIGWYSPLMRKLNKLWGGKKEADESIAGLLNGMLNAPK